LTEPPTHLLQRGTDIRTIQQLLEHNDLTTTMLYTHILQQGGYRVQNPLDDLKLPQGVGGMGSLVGPSLMGWKPVRYLNLSISRGVQGG